MSGHVPRCGQQAHSRQNVSFRAEDFIGSARKVNQAWQRVARPMRGLQLDLLHEDGSSSKVSVSAAVIEVKVAIHDSSYVLHSQAELRQRLQEWTSDDLIVLFEFAVSFAQTRVEHEHLIPVCHDIDRNDDLVSAERLGGRSS